jgi:prolipoprotein diacylglyceryltransferase
MGVGKAESFEITPLKILLYAVLVAIGFLGTVLLLLLLTSYLQG